MRQTLLVVLVVLLMIGIVLPSSAGVGFGVLVSVGSEKPPWSSRLILKEEGTGRDLYSETGIIQPAPDRAIIGQMAFTRDDGMKKGDFDLFYSTMGETCKDGWRQADFNPKAGWSFRIDPREYLTAPLDTWLMLKVRMRRGEKDYVWFIVKFTYALKTTDSHDILVIRPCVPQAQEAAVGTPGLDVAGINDNFGKIGAAVDQLAAGQQKLADGINDTNATVAGLSDRLARLEKWADTVTQSQSTAATQGTWTLKLPPCAAGWAVWYYTKKAGSVGPLYGSEIQVPVCGVVWVEAEPAGGRWKSWHRVEVKPGQVVNFEEVK